MITVIENRQRKIKGNELESFKTVCRQAVEAVLTSEHTGDELRVRASALTVYITFVSSERIKEMNKTYRGINKTTDVLSFPMLDMSNGYLNQLLDVTDVYLRADGTREIVLGDVLVCFDRVFSQAQQIGHSAKHELFFLVVHSILHLIGYDHIDSEEEKRMLVAQRAIMKGYRE